ncbi:MAG TPA: RDD family protein [Bacillota bacterium]|nr:RDD family protein [Bacillota bacterium]
MEREDGQVLLFPVGSVIDCEYTDPQGKMKQITAVVKSVAKDQLVILLNLPDSTTTLPLGKEIFLTVSQGSDTQTDSRKFVCYVIDEDATIFPMLTVTPPIERPKLSTTQSFYCRVKLPLLYFINKIEFSGDVINLSVIRFFAVVDYNPELNPGMMLNFQLALPSKIYTNLVGEILKVHRLTNNQMAVIVNFLNTPPDLQSAIVKYLFQRQHELVQSKQPVVIEPKKSTRKSSSGSSSIDEDENRRQFLFSDPKDWPDLKDSKASMNSQKSSDNQVFKSGGSPGKFSGDQYLQYAGFWIRGVALLLDLVILTIFDAITTVLFAIIVMLVSHTSIIGDTWSRILIPSQSFLTGFSIIIGFALYWIYFTTLESSGRQATFGKRWLGIMVTSEKGKTISLGVAGKRALFRILSGVILFIGFIMAGFSPKKQTLHDLLTKTIVIGAVPKDL